MDTKSGPGSVVMDVARYSARDAEHLVRLHAEMVRAIRSRFPGFVDARLAQCKDGTWLDVISWESAAAAEAAIAGEPSVPEYQAFAGQIERVVWSDCVVVASALDAHAF